jgi:hypothetical protein
MSDGGRRRVLALVVIAAVTWASLTPAPPSSPGRADLVVHLAMHGGLVVAALGAWSRSVALRLVVVLAVALELLQLRVPGRSFDTADLAANLVGVAAGARVFDRLGGRLRRPAAASPPPR